MWKTRKYSKKKRGKNFIDIGVRTLQNMADGISIQSTGKKTLIWESARARIYAFTNVFTQKTPIKIWKTKEKEKEIAVITLGKEISHITEKTTKPIKI